MPIEIKDKTKCTGCGACVNICPRKCVELKADGCGFEYPNIELTSCVNCGLCETICPLLNEIKSFNNILAVYAGWNTDPEIRLNSTSGGIFSALAYSIVNAGGCVVGAKYGDNKTIHHAIVSSKAGVERIRQSKYAQSQIGSVFIEIKKALKDYKVLFCGAPCQVAGLISFLKGRPDNLYTVDFICRGVNSPKAYREWLREIEEVHSAKVTRVWFKYKDNGWKKSPRCTRIDFENDSYIVQRDNQNTFMTGYLGPNLYIRPSCGNCKFKGMNRFGDITVGDFWGIEEKYDDDKGTSLILINSEHGKELFHSIRDRIFTVEKNIDVVSNGNICFADSVVINPKSCEFLKALGEEPFSKMMKKYTKKSLIDRIKVYLYQIKKKIKTWMIKQGGA